VVVVAGVAVAGLSFDFGPGEGLLGVWVDVVVGIVADAGHEPGRE